MGLELGIPRLPVCHPAAEARRRALAMIAASGVPPQFKAPGALGPALTLHDPDFGGIELGVDRIARQVGGIELGFGCIDRQASGIEPRFGRIDRQVGHIGHQFGPSRQTFGPALAPAARTSGRNAQVD
jgi:hypothetical protein